ncbi:translation initiation factor IF-2-like [Acinonyx jubatus]|uniref:Translation initiation factor IF-2-like n=1 Tax=Acinonyx jubatus TaxID=32536 RepID=A0ABM3PYW2_ACIJB|nr:translation initiation factor IF-2-like [Acinonyx jubatus]
MNLRWCLDEVEQTAPLDTSSAGISPQPPPLLLRLEGVPSASLHSPGGYGGAGTRPATGRPRPLHGLRSGTGRPIPGRPNLCRPGVGLPLPPRRPGRFPFRPRPSAPTSAGVQPLGPEGELRRGRSCSPRPGSPARPPRAPHSLTRRLDALPRRRRCAFPQCNFISSSAARHAHGARSPRTRMREGRSRGGRRWGLRMRVRGRVTAAVPEGRKPPRLAPRGQLQLPIRRRLLRQWPAPEWESVSSHRHNGQ